MATNTAAHQTNSERMNTIPREAVAAQEEITECNTATSPPSDDQPRRPSLLHPTRNFLYKNFLKVDLQNRCRELGIDEVWLTKDQLIEKILEKSQRSQNVMPEAETGLSDTDSDTDNTDVASAVREMTAEIRKIAKKLETKDLEIELLNKEMKSAHNQISEMKQQISSLEEKLSQNNVTRNEPEASHTPSPPPARTLLLGDENLGKALPSYLGKHHLLRTLDGANVDLLRCWISEKLTLIPSKCVIYCGVNDIIRNTDPDSIIDNFSTLINVLKEKNKDMEVHICQLVPTLLSQDIQAKIGDLNEHLKQWGISNSIPIINTVPAFRLGTGELDDMCYDMIGSKPGSTLNRLGVVRLLSSIQKQCRDFKLCSNWEKVKRSAKIDNEINCFENSPSPPRLDKDKDGWQVVGRQRNQRYHRSKPANPRVSTYRPQSHLTPPTYSAEQDERHHHHHVARGDLPPHPHHRRPYPHHHLSNHHHHRETKKHGCYNCGEFNHHQSNCRYDHKIKCGNCNRLGHKNRLCEFYSV